MTHNNRVGRPHRAMVTAPGLSRRALTLRTVHVLIAVIELGSLAHVWRCALTRRRDQRLRVAITLLAAEGLGLVAGHGDCPLAPLQQRWADPVPLFELVLPPRAARAAVPALFAITVSGLVTLLARRPRPAAHEAPDGGTVPGSTRQATMLVERRCGRRRAARRA